MVFLLSLVAQILKAHQHPATKRYQNLRRKYQQQKKHHFHAKASRAAITNPGYAGEWHKLLTLVQFDIPTAERLLVGCQRSHPGKPDRWYIEKVIYDLERDRHC